MIDQEIKGAFERVRGDINRLDDQVRELHKLLREVTPRTTSSKAPRSNLKTIEKNILRKLDVAQIKKAISHYIDEGYKTLEIKDQVMNRFNIKPTCFYKYLKELRQQLRQFTPRSNLK